LAQLVYISADDVANKLSWPLVVDALRQGHTIKPAVLSDQFLSQGANTLLSRAAWLEGVGIGVKSVTVMPENTAKGLPSVQGAMLVFDEINGTPRALIDNQLITYWKTAADSALGTSLLARPNSERVLIVGAGVVAESLVHAYQSILPSLKQFEIWNRTADRAESLAAKLSVQGYQVNAAKNLPEACAHADIIASATFASTPVLDGAYLSPGTHVDLIGAFTADMREANDELIRRASIFVDCFDTTLDHIGELKIPLEQGLIQIDDVLGDFYSLVAGQAGRESDDEITVFKNGGGAHLDLMTAKVILEAAGR